MGMFKDLKKLKDQSKEIGEQTGRPTSMMGMLKDTPNMLHQATEAVDDAMAMQADMQKQQALLTSGTPGKATIKGFTDTGALVNFNPQVVLDLSVEVGGNPAYDVQVSTSVPQVMLGRLQPGGAVGVKVDPSNPASLAIDWAASV